MTREPAPAERDTARREHLLLTVLVLLSFALHLWRTDTKGIWGDEGFSLLRAKQSLGDILANRLPLPGVTTTDQHPPLYFLLLRGVLRVGGESDLALHLPSAAFATLLVVLLYLMGTRLRNRRAGLWAALLGACSPFLLWYSQEARMYTMVAALGLAAIYALWRALTENRWTWAVAFGVLSVAAVATQYLFGLLVPCALALALLLWPRGGGVAMRAASAEAPADAGPTRRTVRRSRGLALAVVGAFVLVIVALTVERVVRAIPTLAAGREYIPLGSILLDALNAFSLGLSVERSHIWPLLIVFGGVYLLGLVSLWRQPPRTAPSCSEERLPAARWAALVVTAGYIVIPILGLWAVSLLVPIYMGSRYVLQCSPAFYIGLGVGLEAVGRRWRWPGWVLGAVLLAGMGLSIHNYFAVDPYRIKEEYSSAARMVASSERVGDAIIVDAPENLAIFAHYYDGSSPVIPLPAVAMTGNPDRAKLEDDLRQVLTSCDRVWLVHAGTRHSDPEDLVLHWLDTNALLLRRKFFPSYISGVTVSAYLARSPLEETPVGAAPRGAYAGRLALLDYSLAYRDARGALFTVGADSSGEASAMAGEVPPGRVIAVRLMWHTLQPLDAYRTSLRLVDENGVIWSQNDAEPYLYLPTTEWPVGATVRHETDVAVTPGTPPGTYRLQMWLYRAEDGAVLACRDEHSGAEQTCVTLAEIRVGAQAVTVGSAPWPPSAAQRVRWGTSFGRTFELDGYLLSPETVRPGEMVVLQLYWRALRRSERDCELVINWESADGVVWHSTTHSLTGTAYGTRQWQTNQLLRGNLPLQVPADAPAGVQRLHLLVRDRSDGSLLWVYRGPIWGASRDLASASVVIE